MFCHWHPLPGVHSKCERICMCACIFGSVPEGPLLIRVGSQARICKRTRTRRHLRKQVFVCVLGSDGIVCACVWHREALLTPHGAAILARTEHTHTHIRSHPAPHLLQAESASPKNDGPKKCDNRTECQTSAGLCVCVRSESLSYLYATSAPLSTIRVHISERIMFPFVQRHATCLVRLVTGDLRNGVCLCWHVWAVAGFRHRWHDICTFLSARVWNVLGTEAVGSIVCTK